MEKIETHKIPSVAECITALNRHGSGLVDGANCLSKDTFAQKSIENKKKMKSIEEKAIRTFYDQTEVKKASLEDNMWTQEERNGVIGGVGALYMCSFLLKKVMADNFGTLLSESSRGAAAVYAHCINHIELVCDLLLAFTDRFSSNVKECGQMEFGINLEVDKLCTDIDILAINNVINAFSTRFVKTIKDQEEYIRQKLDEEKERELVAKEVEKLRIKEEQKRLKAERIALKEKEEALKIALEEEQARQKDEADKTVVEEAPKKKRGRPRKIQNAEL